MPGNQQNAISNTPTTTDAVTATTTDAVTAQKINRTWTQYWHLDSEVIDIQNKYNKVLDRPITFEHDDGFFSATTNLQYFKYKTDEESANIETIEYKNIKRIVYANYYNIVSYKIDNKKVIITLADPVNFREEIVDTDQIKLALSEETDNIAPNPTLSEHEKTTLNSANQAIKNVRAKIDNSIKYKRLNSIQKLWFGFKRFWSSYHNKPLRSTIYTWIAIAVLLYLQAGFLSFTPVSTILLGATIFLTIPLVSSLFYIRIDKLLVRIANDGAENKEEHADDHTIKKILRSIGCNPKMQATLGLWIITLVAITTFCVAVANSFAYSMFLTASATSFMLFPASLWGCFAVAAIAGLILYSINASSFKGGDMFDDAPISSDDKTTILGIECEQKSVLTLLGESVKNAASSAKQALLPALMDTGYVMTNDREALKIMHAASAAPLRAAATLAAATLAAQNTHLLNASTDNNPLIPKGKEVTL
jgi:hypothetical protein